MENNTTRAAKQYHLSEAQQAIRLAGLRAEREPPTLDNMEEISRLCSVAHLSISRALFNHQQDTMQDTALKQPWQMTFDEYRRDWFERANTLPPETGETLTPAQERDERLVRDAWAVRVAKAVGAGEAVAEGIRAAAREASPAIYATFVEVGAEERTRAA